MLGERLGIQPGPHLFEQACGALDVREQERHCPRGQVPWHAPSIVHDCALDGLGQTRPDSTRPQPRSFAARGWVPSRPRLACARVRADGASVARTRAGAQMRLRLLGLEGVGHGLLERHLSTDSEGRGDLFFAEFGYERASRLFAQTLQIGRGGVSGFLT